MLYTRTIFKKLELELSTKEATLITGMRRVGKTTALLHLFDLITSGNKALFDLENPLHRKIFEEENYDVLWSNLKQFGISNTSKSYIFIDEIQNLPEISKVVKYLYDHWDVKFFLTGSSSYYLRNLFPESLAGRKLIFEMYPLTFEEFLIFKGTKRVSKISFSQKAAEKNEIAHSTLGHLFHEYMEYGGFPSVVLEPNYERKKLLLSEIFTSYFEKDAKNLADFRDMSKLRDLILILVPRIGSKIDIQKIAVTLSLTRETVYSYLSFLEQTYFIGLVAPFSYSIDRQSAGSKKLYLCDSGIARALGSPSEGQMLEQTVYQTIRTNHSLHFYNKDGKSEIDFILDKHIAVEVKTSASKRDSSRVKRIGDSIGVDETYVVSAEYSERPEVVSVTDL